MFKGALYKFSYMYSEDYISDCCIKETPLTNLPPSELTDFCSLKFPNQTIKYLKRYKYFGYTYEPGMFIVDTKENNYFIFFEIKAILLLPDDCFFVCFPCKFTYKKNLHAYKLISRRSDYILSEISDNWIEPLISYKIQRCTYVCPPFKLFE